MLTYPNFCWPVLRSFPLSNRGFHFNNLSQFTFKSNLLIFGLSTSPCSPWVVKIPTLDTVSYEYLQLKKINLLITEQISNSRWRTAMGHSGYRLPMSPVRPAVKLLSNSQLAVTGYKSRYNTMLAAVFTLHSSVDLWQCPGQHSFGTVSPLPRCLGFFTDSARPTNVAFRVLSTENCNPDDILKTQTFISDDF